MATATVDNLEIKLTADTGEASSGIAKLKQSIEKLSNSSKNLKKVNTAFSKLGKSIMRIGFYRLLRSAIKGITDAVKEGTQNLYLYSDAIGGKFSDSLDTASTAMQYLKNGFATAFAPLVELVVPYLDAAIDKMVELMNSINQVVAYLRGEDTFTRAVKVAKKYSDSLDGVKDSADEAKRSLLGFDEINRLSENNVNGKNTADPSIMFEEVKVDTVAAQSLWEKLEPILKIVRDIGVEFAAWKIAGSLFTGLNTLSGLLGNIAAFGALVIGVRLVWDGLEALYDDNPDNDLMGAVKTAIGSALGGAALGYLIGGKSGLEAGLDIGLAFGGLMLMFKGIQLITNDTNDDDLLALVIGAIGGGLMGAALNPDKSILDRGLGFATGLAITLGLMLAIDGSKKGNLWETLSGMVLTALGIAGVIKKFTPATRGLSLKTSFLLVLGLSLTIDGSQKGNLWEELIGEVLTGLGIYSLLDVVSPALANGYLVLTIPALAILDLQVAVDSFGTLKEQVDNAIAAAGGDWTKAKFEYAGFDAYQAAKKTSDNKSQVITTEINKKNQPRKSQVITTEINKKNQPRIEGYASGGFPEDGLFFANHNELVGQFSNGKTAVANNAQIVDGIKEGVYEAVFSAMNNSDRESDNVVKVYLDGKQIAETTTRRQWQTQRALGV